MRDETILDNLADRVAAKVLAVLEQGKIVKPGPLLGDILVVGNMTIDCARREVTVNGEPKHLTGQAFDALEVLARNKGQVLSREQMLELAWSEDARVETSSRTVDVFVHRLRHQLAESDAKIETVQGLGYKLSSR